MHEELLAINKAFQSYMTYEDNKVESLPFITDSFELNFLKKKLMDFSLAIDKGLLLGNNEVPSLKETFKILKKNGTLSIASLSDVLSFLRSVEYYKVNLKDYDQYEVHEIYLDLNTFPSQKEELERCITPDLKIADKASGRLYSIRKEIEKINHNLDKVAIKARQKYKDFLMDENISFKNGYSTIAIDTSKKNLVDGLIVSSSSSGSTSYIVPKEVLMLQSKLMELKSEEKEEEARIIRELSDHLSMEQERLFDSYQRALEIDKINSIVLFGKSYKGCIAKDGESIRLAGLGHPLIPLENLVTNDLILNDHNPKILLISGPNAGGKTVFLKSVALAVLLNQAGLFVPCQKEAILPLFDKVHFLSGDKQSVLDNLSTFSSHVKELKKIASDMNKKTLVVIDEIGQGTSPSEGSALGVAFINKAKRLGSYLLLSSHYDDLKNYALANEEVLSAMMQFDEKDIKPTFKIIYGRAGQSFGLAVAEKLGLDDEIIHSAKSYIESLENDDYHHSLKILNTKLQEVEQNLVKLEQEKALLVKQNEKRQRAILALEEEKESLHRRSDKIVEKEVERRLEEVDEIWQKEKPITTFAEMSKIKGQLNEKLENKNKTKVAAKKQEERIYEVGDHVRILISGNVGQIKGKKGKSYLVSSEGMTFAIEGKDLEPFTPNNKPKKHFVRTNDIDRLMSEKGGASIECNLIGMRVDEAKKKLLKYLDDCLISHYHQVRVIHGVGTGALMKMVQTEIKKLPYVSSYRFGGEGEGGVGSTVVYFK